MFEKIHLLFNGFIQVYSLYSPHRRYLPSGKIQLVMGNPNLWMRKHPSKLLRVGAVKACGEPSKLLYPILKRFAVSTLVLHGATVGSGDLLARAKGFSRGIYKQFRKVDEGEILAVVQGLKHVPFCRLLNGSVSVRGMLKLFQSQSACRHNQI